MIVSGAECNVTGPQLNRPRIVLETTGAMSQERLVPLTAKHFTSFRPGNGTTYENNGHRSGE